jgi:virulence factor Mce-like protein
VRRALAAGVALVVVAAVVLLGRDSGSPSTYRVAAVFDTAKGMVAGQQVKIAGAPVGTVKEIDLAPGPKARMLLDVDARFGPFHPDATCTILPEGLISENYVECDPGAAAGTLPGDGDGVPTVALRRTTVPVSLQDVLNVFSLPTDQRLRILISELGIGTAGRGQDLNALLRRANPALTASRRVLTTFADQRTQLADAITQTDRVLKAVGDQSADVRTFVDRAATVARTTAAHDAGLGQSIKRMPAMLDAVRPGLRSLDRAATNATPLLDALRASAPGLATLTTTLPALSRAGTPALKSLSEVADVGRPVVRGAVSTAKRLQRATAELGPLAPEVDALLVSLRKTGGVEATMRLLYTLAALTATYDGTSHLINFIANVAPNCLAAEAAHTDSPGCSHKWSAPGQGTIPINQPSCGPQQPQDLWRNHYCPLAVPVGTFPGRSGKGGAAKPKLPSLKLPKLPAGGGKPSGGAAEPAPSGSGSGGRPSAPAAPPLDLGGSVTALLDYLLK